MIGSESGEVRIGSPETEDVFFREVLRHQLVCDVVSNIFDGDHDNGWVVAEDPPSFPVYEPPDDALSPVRHRDEESAS